MTVSADRTADIFRLLASYALYIDTRDAPAWLDLFAADGELEMVGTSFAATGRDELAGFHARGQGGVHLTGVPLVSEDESGLSSVSAFTYVNTRLDLIMTGHYRDRYVEEGGSLRFARREITIVRD